MTSEVIIRRYNQADLKVLLDLSNEEGWDISHIDLRASIEVDTNGLLVAEDKAGTPVGFIGLFTMSPGMTYLDYFLVRKDLRGKGIGKQLWSAMLNATKGNILVLDGLSEMNNWYKQQGFIYEAYYTKFCTGTVTPKEFVTDHGTYDIVPLSDEEWPALVAYDKRIYPYDRENVLRAWLRGTDVCSVVAMHDKNVVGYANFHMKSEKECNIRALCGDEPAVADALLENLLQKIPVESVISFDLMGDKALPKCFQDFQCLGFVYRLYTKEITGFHTQKLFFNMAHMV